MIKKISGLFTLNSGNSFRFLATRLGLVLVAAVGLTAGPQVFLSSADAAPQVGQGGRAGNGGRAGSGQSGSGQEEDPPTATRVQGEGGSATGPGRGGPGPGGGPGGSRGGSSFGPGGSRKGVERTFEEYPEESMVDPIFGSVGPASGRGPVGPGRGAAGGASRGSTNRNKGENRDAIVAEANRSLSEKEAAAKAEAKSSKKKVDPKTVKGKKKRRRMRLVADEDRNSKPESFTSGMSAEQKEKMGKRIEEAASSFVLLVRFLGITLVAVMLGVVGFVGKSIVDSRSREKEKIARQKRMQRKW